VSIAAIVDADGVIREAKVVQSLDKTYGLDEQALSAVRAMAFKPAELDGRPVRTFVRIEMQFTLR
jgi:TonB family protein